MIVAEICVKNSDCGFVFKAESEAEFGMFGEGVNGYIKGLTVVIRATNMKRFKMRFLHVSTAI